MDVQKSMATWSISEARASLAQILERVRDGEEVTLTRHGEAVAVVVRPDLLRVRRAEGVLQAASALREQIVAARRAPRPPRTSASRQRAEALVAEVRASRTHR